MHIVHKDTVCKTERKEDTLDSVAKGKMDSLKATSLEICIFLVSRLRTLYLFYPKGRICDVLF